MWFGPRTWTTPKGRVLTPDDADELLELLTRLESRVEELERLQGYSVDPQGDQVIHVGREPGLLDHSN